MTERIYTPDLWAIIEFTSDEHVKTRKILGSWYGGYTGSDSWRLSSGNEGEPTYEGGIYRFPQHSGSVYVCYDNVYGMSGYTQAVYSNFLDMGLDMTLIQKPTTND